jgi:peroxiredoxin (alkyl hydroperoxide reductase subunit C)
MLGDGSAEFTKKLGLELDLTARGLGVRSDRYAMIVEDGVVKSLDREAPGKFEVSDAVSILKKL